MWWSTDCIGGKSGWIIVWGGGKSALEQCERGKSGVDNCMGGNSVSTN